MRPGRAVRYGGRGGRADGEGMRRLRVSRLGEPVRELCLSGEVTIGRDPAAALSLRDEAVSVEHARLRLEGAELLLTDLGSTNGTIVDGARLAAHEPLLLAGGERIAIGSYRIEVLHELHRPASDEELPVLPEVTVRRHSPVVRVLAVLALVSSIAALATVVVTRLL